MAAFGRDRHDEGESASAREGFDSGLLATGCAAGVGQLWGDLSKWLPHLAPTSAC